MPLATGFLQGCPVVTLISQLRDLGLGVGHVMSRIFSSRPTFNLNSSSEQDWQIRCIIQGDNVTFPVKISENDDISELKSLILRHACHGVLQHVDSKDLVLHKVRNVFSLVIIPLLMSCA